MLLLLLFVLAHILTDFTFQSSGIAAGKHYSFFKLLKHLLIYFSITLLLTLYLLSYKLIYIICLLAVLHGLIDIIKIRLENKIGDKISLELFFIDQLLHFLSLIAFYPVIKQFTVHPLFIILYNNLNRIYPFISNITYSQVFYLVVVINIIIFNFKGSNIIVEKILRKYRAEFNENGNSKGCAIGNLERILVIVFVLINNYSLIGLLFTAKSLIRFKEVEESNKKNKNFVEYYLIGTFSSILIALLSGLVINVLK